MDFGDRTATIVLSPSTLAGFHASAAADNRELQCWARLLHQGAYPLYSDGVVDVFVAVGRVKFPLTNSNAPLGATGDRVAKPLIDDVITLGRDASSTIVLNAPDVSRQYVRRALARCGVEVWRHVKVIFGVLLLRLRPPQPLQA